MSDVLDFGAAGDGKTDDTEAILHAIRDGVVDFPRGDYVVTKTIPIELSQVGRTGLRGAAGTAKIIMAGAGPAFSFLGHAQQLRRSGHLMKSRFWRLGMMMSESC
jgi:hypothetical protein